MKKCLTQKNPKMCDPILVTLLKMRLCYSQSSRENTTPSSAHPHKPLIRKCPPPPPPVEDLAQMIYISQFVSLYRGSERPNTGQEGHNEVKNVKKDKRAILFSPFYLEEMESYWSLSVSRAEQAHSCIQISSTARHKGQPWFINIEHKTIKHLTRINSRTFNLSRQV